MTARDSWRVLFEIGTAHAYFDGRPVPGLTLQVSAQDAATMRRAGCSIRPTPRGGLVLQDLRQVDALPGQIDADPDHAGWRFELHGHDDDALRYTDGLAASGLPQPLVYEAAALPQGLPKGEGQAGQLLNPLPPGSASGNIATLATTTSTASRGRRPLALVHIDPQLLRQLASPPDRRAPVRPHPLWLCRMEARAAPWRYLLVGRWTDDAQDTLRIVDSAGDMQFGPTRAVRLPDGRHAVMLQTTRPHGLRSRSSRRLQLRSQRGEHEQVLVQRLPLASPVHLTRHEAGDGTTLIFDIHVHP